jgi:hypothetical protein
MVKDNDNHMLHEVLATLDAREAAILALRFGLDDGRPKTLKKNRGMLWCNPGADSTNPGARAGENAPRNRKARSSVKAAIQAERGAPIEFPGVL